MKLPILIIVLHTFYSLSSLSQELPKYITEKENIIPQNYIHPVNPLFSNPPPLQVRGMAEWEELQGIIITWRDYLFILSKIVDYAQEEGLVYIICDDSVSVKDFLTNQNVPLKNLIFLITPSNSIWARDYGPWTVYTNDIDSLNIIDWMYTRNSYRAQDDVTPEFFANYMGVPIYQTTTSPYDLLLAGGNLIIDGHGTAFSSNIVLEQNPDHSEVHIDSILNRYIGINRYIKMIKLPIDLTSHLDMHMKLLDEETLLVGEYPQGISDGPQIEKNLEWLIENFQTCFGRKYKIVRIPMPPDAHGQYPSQGGAYRTYTNSMIINKTVIIPTYNSPYDTTAIRIYKEAMPGYNIVGINCNRIIPQYGAVHCIVKEVGAFDPVFISHAKMESIVDDTDSIMIKSINKSNSGISEEFVYWTTDTSNGFQALPMDYKIGDTSVAFIPPQTYGTEVYYYISATSNRSKTITKPMTAPEGFYKFTVDHKPTDVEILSGPGGFSISQNYPNPFNPVTTIQFQIPELNFITLTIYDILGNKITTLINEQKPAGSYFVDFDGSNLPSGVYFYTIQAGTFIKTKKMILLK